MAKARKMLMNESFEIKGIWFLPGQDMQKDGVKGFLKYSPKETTLDLIGTFQKNEEEFILTMLQPAEKLIIYGFSDSGKCITLCDCLSLSGKMSFPGFSTTSYLINRFFIGTQYINSENDKIIETCNFSFTYLDAWLADLQIMNKNFNPKTIDSNISIDSSRLIGQKKKISLQKENVSICEAIFYKFIFPSEYYTEETTEIVFNRFYRLSSNDDRLLSYNDCSAILHKLKRLLTLLIGSPLYVSFIELNLPAEMISSSEGEPVEQRPYCRAFFTQGENINKKNNIFPYKPNSVLINRNDIKNSIETIFSNWFSLQDKISEIANPYIIDFYLPTYQESKFLNIVRCLETYHRTFLSVPLETTNDVTFENSREKIISFINTQIPIENRQSFLDRVNYEDEGSLQKRLKDLFKKTPNTLMDRLFKNFKSKDVNTMAQKIAQTRNYYTHRDNKQKYTMLINNSGDLDFYINKLTVILQFWLLSCIGIEKETIENRLVHFDKNQSAFT